MAASDHPVEIVQKGYKVIGLCINLHAAAVTNDACIIALNLFLYNVSFSGVCVSNCVFVQAVHSVFGIVMRCWLLFLASRAVLFEYLLSVQCVSNIGHIIKSVCVSTSQSVSQSVTQNELNALQIANRSSPNLPQICRAPMTVI